MTQLYIDGNEYIIQVIYPESTTLSEEDAAYVEDALRTACRSIIDLNKDG